MNISEVTISQVRSAYTGKVDRCCCGCSGTHVYNERNRAKAAKWRGYEVSDDEVNDKKVERILNKIKKDPNSSVQGDFISLETERKLYIVYLLEENEGA